jgi:hypothetical protein
MPFRALLTDARFERFYDYWQALRGDRPMPARRDLDPADIKDLLPQIGIIQVVGNRFLIRLAGTELVNRIGADNTGRYFDEVHPLGGYSEFMTRVYETVRDTRRAVLSETDYSSGVTEAGIRRLSLPFSNDGVEVSHIVSLLLFFWPKNSSPLLISDEGRAPKGHRIAGVDDET